MQIFKSILFFVVYTISFSLCAMDSGTKKSDQKAMALCAHLVGLQGIMQHVYKEKNPGFIPDCAGDTEQSQNNEEFKRKVLAEFNTKESQEMLLQAFHDLENQKKSQFIKIFNKYFQVSNLQHLILEYAEYRSWLKKIQQTENYKGYQAIKCFCNMSETRVAAGNDSGTLTIFDIKNEKKSSFIAHTNGIFALCILTDGTLVSSGFDGLLKFWNIKDLNNPCKCHEDKRYYHIHFLCSLPNNRFATFSDEEGNITIESYRDNKHQQLKTWKPENGRRNRCIFLTFYSDGKLVAGNSFGTCYIWDCNNPEIKLTLKHPIGNTLYGTGCLLQNKTLVITSGLRGRSDNYYYNDLDFLDISGKEFSTIEYQLSLSIYIKNIECLSVLKDGRIVSGSNDNVIRIYDLSNKQTPIFESLVGHSVGVTALAQMSDGSLISGSSFGEIIHWQQAPSHLELVWRLHNLRKRGPAVWTKQNISGLLSYMSKNCSV